MRIEAQMCTEGETIQKDIGIETANKKPGNVGKL